MEALDVVDVYDFDFGPFMDHPVMLWDKAVELFEAIDYQDLPLVESLLKKGCPTHVANEEGKLPVHVAAAAPSTEILELVLEHAKNTEEKSKYWDVNSKDKNGCTPLHLASVYRYISNVSYLIKHGCDVSIIDKNGWTALDYAILPPNMKLVNILLKATRKDQACIGTSALFTAIRNNLEDLFLALLPLQDDLNIYSGCGTHLLHYCFQQNKVKLAEHLLEYAPDKVDVTVVDMYGENSLFHLCKCDGATPALAEKLIKLGCSVDQATISNEFPIDEAVRHRRADLTQVMLSHNAEVNNTDFEGCSPLHKAVKSRSTACVSLLLQHGADMRAISLDNETVISMSLHNSNSSMAFQFIQEGYNAHAFCLQLKKDIQRGIIFSSDIFGMDTDSVNRFISCGLKVLPLALLCRNVVREYFIDHSLPYCDIGKLDVANYYVKYIMMKDTVFHWINSPKNLK